MDEESKDAILDWQSLPPLLTVPEASRLLRIGRNACYDAIRRNELPHLRIGRRISVPKHGLMEMLGVDPAAALGPPTDAAPKQPQATRDVRRGEAVLPLPRLKPILLDRLDPGLVSELLCGAEMPDGSLGLLTTEGSQITVTTDAAELSQSFVRLAVRRKPRR